MSRIYQVFGDDAHDMCMALLEASKAWRLMPEGGTIALKPNLVLADTADRGAVTHPGIVAACIEYFRAHGASDICVIESSWVGERSTANALERSGIGEVCRRLGVPFHDLKRDKTVAVETPIGRIPVCRKAAEAGLLVDLPVLKGHCQTRMTCALKNLKGCIPDSEKRRFHTLGLTRPIAALACALAPALTIVDSICGDLDFEEGGTPIQTMRMYLAYDAVQADAFGRSLMGLSPDEVPYIELAEQFGAGSTAFSAQDVVNLNEPTDATRYETHLPSTDSLVENVHADQACSACYAALVRALYVTGRCDVTTCIGQGWQDKTFAGLGIGRCARGVTQCVMGCPPSATDIAEALMDFR